MSDWNSTDYAKAVRRIASTITCDCQGEIVLVTEGGTLFAFGRTASPPRAGPPYVGPEDIAVYIASTVIDDEESAGGYEVVGGRRALKALRDLIDRELAEGT